MSNIFLFWEYNEGMMALFQLLNGWVGVARDSRGVGGRGFHTLFESIINIDCVMLKVHQYEGAIARSAERIR